VFFYGAAYQKSQSAVFMLPDEGVPSAVVWTVRRWCLACAAGLEESFTRAVPRLQSSDCSRHHASWNATLNGRRLWLSSVQWSPRAA